MRCATGGAATNPLRGLLLPWGVVATPCVVVALVTALLRSIVAVLIFALSSEREIVIRVGE